MCFTFLFLSYNFYFMSYQVFLKIVLRNLMSVLLHLHADCSLLTLLGHVVRMPHK